MTWLSWPNASPTKRIFWSTMWSWSDTLAHNTNPHTKTIHSQISLIFSLSTSLSDRPRWAPLIRHAESHLALILGFRNLFQYSICPKHSTAEIWAVWVWSTMRPVGISWSHCQRCCFGVTICIARRLSRILPELYKRAISSAGIEGTYPVWSCASEMVSIGNLVFVKLV